jgi:hypothetical protein
MRNAFASVIFGIEYMYQSAMEYLSATYHNYQTNLKDIPVSEPVRYAIQEGASAARDTGEGSGEGYGYYGGGGYGNVVF